MNERTNEQTNKRMTGWLIEEQKWDRQGRWLARRFSLENTSYLSVWSFPANNLTSVGGSGTSGFGPPDIRIWCPLISFCKHFSPSMDFCFWRQFGHQGDILWMSDLGWQATIYKFGRLWLDSEIYKTDVPRTSRGRQSITSKFGQNLMFTRYFWHLQDV